MTSLERYALHCQFSRVCREVTVLRRNRIQPFIAMLALIEVIDVCGLGAGDDGDPHFIPEGVA